MLHVIRVDTCIQHALWWAEARHRLGECALEGAWANEVADGLVLDVVDNGGEERRLRVGAAVYAVCNGGRDVVLVPHVARVVLVGRRACESGAAAGSRFGAGDARYEVPGPAQGWCERFNLDYPKLLRILREPNNPVVEKVICMHVPSVSKIFHRPIRGNSRVVSTLHIAARADITGIANGCVTQPADDSGVHLRSCSVWRHRRRIGKDRLLWLRATKDRGEGVGQVEEEKGVEWIGGNEKLGQHFSGPYYFPSSMECLHSDFTAAVSVFANGRWKQFYGLLREKACNIDSGCILKFIYFLSLNLSAKPTSNIWISLLTIFAVYGSVRRVSNGKCAVSNIKMTYLASLEAAQNNRKGPPIRLKV